MYSSINLFAFLVVTAYGFYLFAHLVYSRYLFIKLGKKSKFEPHLKERINNVLINVFGQRKLFKDPKSGIMHFVMFYGFIILQFGALELIIKGLVEGYELPFGSAHKYFSLTQEWTTVLVLFAVAYAYYRRYIEKLKRLKRGLKSGLVIIFLSTLMISILLSLGFEKIMLGHEQDFMYAPFSGLVTAAFSGIGVTAGTILFYVFWWLHLLTLLSFMVYVPQSKHSHVIFASINVFFKKIGSPGKLKTIDFEEEGVEEFGVGKVENFTQQQLIDLYACVECGRCTNVCPASGTGKLLSPMHLITKLRDHLTVTGAAHSSRSPWMPAFAFPNAQINADIIEPPVSLIGDVITETELWACTTCRNCEDQCPVMNEHVVKIIDMRRYLVMTKGEMPADATRYFQNVERQSNPWGINRNDRIKWREGMEDIVKTVNETEQFDVLFWVGSMGSFDIRSQKVAKSFARLMHKANVKLAILGNEEKNSGDTARRMGNEYLFQDFCNQNIEIFRKYGVRKIVTTDPHAFNTFKNEYPEFGLEAEVVHHTQFLNELLKEGKLQPTIKVDEKIAYHDSCYIGRYNDIYDTPREILRAIPGIELLEMERNRENALCCGAGGGLMWMEEHEGTRMNVARTEMALSTNPTVIGSNCPYCLTMMSDGTKAKEVEDRVETLDIAEILEGLIA